jgi:5-methylcytosine-specific restriction endonuclease McrA
VKAAIRQLVRERAGNRCEYCHLHQDDSPLAVLHVEHIRAKKHGGGDDPENLCLACIDCNLHKGSNLTGIDPVTEAVTQLFNPRKAVWEDHFAWEGIYIIGSTATGRATVGVLDLNGDDRLDLRRLG